MERQGTLARLISTKRVGFFGAFTLLFNAATGPGIPFTAANFQSPGWVFTVAVFILFTIISGFSVLFIVEAMQALPGNRHFQGTVEYATLIHFYFGPITHMAGQFFLYGALQSNAIQNIILSAQATDNLLIDIFGKTCGLSAHGWICVKGASGLPSPFGNTFMIFTLGLLVIAIIAIPLGFMDMDDNILVQMASFVLSFLIVFQWDTSAILSASGLESKNMPAAVPLSLSYGQTLGTVMLNLAITTVVPSWINLKQKDVSAQKVVWTAVWSTSTFYIVSSLFLALGFSIDSSNNVLSSLLTQGVPSSLTKVTVGLFAYVMLLPSIPVSLIISKENLVQNRIVPKNVAIGLAFVLPWLVCIPLQTGTALFTFQTWTSLLFVSVTNFIIPVIIYFKCLVFRREYNESRVLTQNQLDLLKEIHRSSSTIHSYISSRSNAPELPPVPRTSRMNNDREELEKGASDSTIVETRLPTVVIAEHASDALKLIIPTDDEMNLDEQLDMLELESSRRPDRKNFIQPAWLREDVPDPEMEDKIENEQLEKLMSPRARSVSSPTEAFFRRMTLSLPSRRNSLKETSRRASDAFMTRREPSGHSNAESSSKDVPTPGGLGSELYLEPLPPRRPSVVSFHTRDEEIIPVPENDTPMNLERGMNMMAEMQRVKTLPMHPNFKSPAFRSVPKWMPVRGVHVAWTLLTVTGLITLLNIVLNLVPQ